MQYQYFNIKELDLSNTETKKNTSCKIAILTISNPPMNVLSKAVLLELQEVVGVIQKQYPIVIVTGKDRAFVAGADIKEMQALSSKQAEEFSALGQQVFSMIEYAPTIFISAINGFAFGGGLELALACNIRICSEKAIMGLPEVSLGLIPGFGGTQRLSKHIGVSNAIFYTTTANNITAQRALEMGLVQQVTKPEELIEESTVIAKKILSNGPNAVSIVKQLICDSYLPKVDSKTYQAERQNFGKIFSTDESKEGMDAFVSKRKANF